MKNHSKRLFAFMLAFMLFVSGIPATTADAAAKQAVAFKAKTIRMYAGETRKAELKAPKTKSAAKKVKFASSNKKLASVSKAGDIKAKKKGTVKVTASYKGKKATLTVKIKKAVKKPSIRLNKKAVTLTEGKNIKLAVKSVKGLSLKKATFKTSNKNVATVGKNNGVVKAKKAGKAIITATSVTNKKVKAKCTVTVAAKATNGPQPAPVEPQKHEYSKEFTVDREPGCETDGEKSRHCTKHPNDSADRTDITVVPATGHSYEESVTDATCTEDGKRVQTCKNCGDEKAETIPAMGHSYSEGFIKQPASCTKDGVMAYTCANCGDEKTETIPAKGHAFGEWETVTMPNCEEEGIKERACTSCGFKEIEGIPANGHDWDTGLVIDKEPTCTEDGSKSLHCANCTLTKDSEIIPKLGHSYENGACIRCGQEEPGTVSVTLGLTDNGTYLPDTVIKIPEGWTLKVDGQEITSLTGEYALKDAGEHTITSISPNGEEKNITIIVSGEGTTPFLQLGSTGTYPAGQPVSVPEGWKLTVNGNETDGSYAFTEEGEYDLTAVDADGNVYKRHITILHAHDWKLTEKAPSCTETGFTDVTCSVCGESIHKEIPALGHDFNGDACTRCGESANKKESVLGFTDGGEYATGTTITVPEGGALLVDGKEVELSDGQYGIKEPGEHVITFRDENGEEKTVTIVVTEDAKTDVSDILSDGTYPAGQTISVPDGATLTVNGQDCDGSYTFDKDGDYEVVVKDKDGNTYVKNIHISHMHEYGSAITKEASCEEDGVLTFTCGICGRSYTQAIPKTGHSWGAYETVKEASCEEAGMKERTCGTCGKKDSVELDALGHDYGPWDIAKEATCTEQGLNERTCTRCGNKDTQATNALGHSPTAEFTIDTEATCTESGLKSKHCTRCGTHLEETEIPALGHSPASEYTVDTAATCTTAGSESQHCVRCDAKLNVREIAALGHSYGNWTVTKAATCMATGTSKRTCTRCRHEETRTDAKLTTHAYSSNYTIDTAATCTANGSKSRHCTVAGCTAKTNVTAIPATGHSYGSWTTVKAATCTETGSEKRTCSVCGHVETRTTTALGHNYSTTYTTDKAATCTAAGSKSQHCTRCSATRNVTSIPALGHSWGSWTTTKAATCTAAGSRKHTCSRCNTTATENITALGHSYSSTYTIDKAATCTTAGSKSRHCTRCSSTTDNTTISATGHTIGKHGSNEPQCPMHFACSGCGMKLNVTSFSGTARSDYSNTTISLTPSHIKYSDRNTLRVESDTSVMGAGTKTINVTLCMDLSSMPENERNAYKSGGYGTLYIYENGSNTPAYVSETSRSLNGNILSVTFSGNYEMWSMSTYKFAASFENSWH